MTKLEITTEPVISFRISHGFFVLQAYRQGFLVCRENTYVLTVPLASIMKDASETLSTSDEEVLKLQKKIEHLQQENKVLHVRAQGVTVLGTVMFC